MWNYLLYAFWLFSIVITTVKKVVSIAQEIKRREKKNGGEKTARYIHLFQIGDNCDISQFNRFYNNRTYLWRNTTNWTSLIYSISHLAEAQISRKIAIWSLNT